LGVLALIEFDGVTDLLKHAGIFCAGGFRGRSVNVSGTGKGCKTNVTTFLSVPSAGLQSAREFAEGTNFM